MDARRSSRTVYEYMIGESCCEVRRYAILDAMDLIAETDANTGQHLDACTDRKQIVIPRREAELRAALFDRHLDAMHFQVCVRHTRGTDEFASADFEVCKEVTVVDKAHLVGFRVSRADQRGAVRCRLCHHLLHPSITGSSVVYALDEAITSKYDVDFVGGSRLSSLPLRRERQAGKPATTGIFVRSESAPHVL